MGEKLKLVSLEDFKKKLGEAGNRLTNKEIEKLLDLQYHLANYLFDLWRKEDKKTFMP